MFLTCQILLIAICAFLHFTPGDAMQCRSCTAFNLSDPCLPQKECEMDAPNETCAALKVYWEGEVVLILRSCSLDKSRCGTTEEFPDKKKVEVSCCDDGDFCNDNL